MKINLPGAGVVHNILALVTVLSISISTAQAGPFDQGNTSGNISLGSGQFFNENYLIIGAGIGHYLLDGFEVGLDIDYWSGGSPSIYEITPKITYVFENSSNINPYLGMFYNRTFIDDLEDSNATGYRAGVYMPTGRRMYWGIGIVHTELQDCTDSAFVDCSDTYSEVSLIFSL